MTNNKKYNQIKSLVQDELNKIEEKICSLINTKEPLNSSLLRFLQAPSKHIRCVLPILYLKAQGQNLSQNQLDILTIVELVHSASLIHDDVIDECNLRRGCKTLSSEFDNKLAVISGDYVLSLAMETLLNLKDFQILNKFIYTIKQMCLGEINQNFDRFKIGTIENYIEKTKKKTAYLFETAITTCVLHSNLKNNLEEVSNFGLNFGIAFQIRDDILNFSNSDISKPYNNDVEEGIYNAPVILGTEEDNYFSGVEKTKILLNNYIKSAEKLVKNLPNNIYKSALCEILELMKNV
jgi:geranylgeranyl pyrophosphate synthase